MSVKFSLFVDRLGHYSPNNNPPEAVSSVVLVN